jgi:CelD/BcsL family acetyltransferase involved in cellulose biosynthesis
MGLLVVERIESEEALAALEPEWTALERSSGNTLPFRTFTWVTCWWKHMHEDRFALKDSLAIRAVRTAEGRLVAVAPLTLTQRPGVGPIRARYLHFMGADPNMTEIRGALCEPALESACYAALHQALTRSSRDFDWIQWSGVEERDGAPPAPRDPALRWSNGVVCSIVSLPSTWEELRSSEPRNLKESLRKCYNSLRRDGLDFALEVIRTLPDVEPALEDFFRLHAARAGLAGTVHHRDVFSQPRCRAFLVDACKRFAARDELRIFRLHVGGALVATRIGFVLGGCAYLYYSGFDPAYAKYSVMTTTLAEAIRHSIAEHLRSVNLSTGKDSSKSRWRPREVSYREALYLSPRLVGRAKYEAIGVAERAIHQPALRHYAERLALVRRAP